MRISFSGSEEKLLARIKSRDARAMEIVYQKNRTEFMGWAQKHYQMGEETSLDHYQDAVTIFFEKVIKGEIVELNSSIKTYLFGIAKNRIKQGFQKELRKQNHAQSLAEHYRYLGGDERAQEVFEQSRSHMKAAYSKLGEGCKQLLQLFYFERKSMTEIAQIMGHKNEAVSRTSKKRCLEQIRKEVHKTSGND